MFDYDVETGELHLYDEISPEGFGGIDAGTVHSALKELSGPLTVRINSPGGHMDEGIAIYNMLDRYKGPVTTINDSLAASIASYIFMAGDQRLVAKNSLTMIHSPWTIAAGNAEDLRKMADLLDKAESTIYPVYQEALGVDYETVKALLDEETWMTAPEAVESGLATEEGHSQIEVEPVPIAAKYFRNTPKQLIRAKEAGSNNPRFDPRKEYEHMIRRTRAKYAV